MRSCKVVELRVGVFRAGDGRELGAGVGDVADDDGRRNIGIEFGCLEARGDVIAREIRRRGRRRYSSVAVDAGKSAAGDEPRLFEDAGLFGVAAKILGDRSDSGLRERERIRVDDADRRKFGMARPARARA